MDPTTPDRVRPALGGLLLAAVLAVCVTCARGAAPAARAADAAPVTPAARLARAIAWAGGARALEHAGALVWDGEAVVHLPASPPAGAGIASATLRRQVRIAGRWAVQPPDTAVVTTYDVTRGPATARALVVAAPRGWIVTADSTGPGLLAGDDLRALARGQFTPMPPALFASERDEFYLYDVLRLVPLREAAVTITSAAPDTAGQPGIVARQPGRPDVALHFGADGRLAHLVVTIPDAASGRPVRQDLWLDGAITAGGVRWPRTLRLTQDGAPFFDLTVRTLRVAPRLPVGWTAALAPVAPGTR